MTIEEMEIKFSVAVFSALGGKKEGEKTRQ